MRKVLALFLISGLLSMFQVEVATSNTPDCPVYWNIDTSSARGEQQLKEAKQRLGINMALEGGLVYYRNPSGSLGPLKSSPKELNGNDVYLYGDTRVEVYYKVQVKGCSPVISNYNITRGTLKGMSGINNFVEGVSASEWAKKNENLFSDFTKVSGFEKCLESKYRIYTEPNPDLIGFQYVSKRLRIQIAARAISTYREFSLEGCGLNTPPAYFRLLELQPECLWRVEDSPLVAGFSVPFGKSCEYAIAVSQASLVPNLYDVLLLQRFTIDAKKWQVKIKCVKGKSTRIVIGLLNQEDKTKCPAGYKKK
jgi:hypothetical protein